MGIPAPKGTGLVAAPISKKLLGMAGVKDCYTSSRGHTRTQGNFVNAVFFALKKTYSYLTPDLWVPTQFHKAPYQEHTDFLMQEQAKPVERAATKSTQPHHNTRGVGRASD